MATIHKLTKAGATIFPATITDAVIHPQTGKTLTSMIKDYNVSELFPTEGVDGGNKYNLVLAIQVLGAHLLNSEKTGGIGISFIPYDNVNRSSQYRLTTANWSANTYDWQEVGSTSAYTSIGSINSAIGELYIEKGYQPGMYISHYQQEVGGRGRILIRFSNGDIALFIDILTLVVGEVYHAISSDGSISAYCVFSDTAIAISGIESTILGEALTLEHNPIITKYLIDHVNDSEETKIPWTSNVNVNRYIQELYIDPQYFEPGMNINTFVCYADNWQLCIKDGNDNIVYIRSIVNAWGKHQSYPAIPYDELMFPIYRTGTNQNPGDFQMIGYIKIKYDRIGYAISAVNYTLNEDVVTNINNSPTIKEIYNNDKEAVLFGDSIPSYPEASKMLFIAYVTNRLKMKLWNIGCGGCTMAYRTPAGTDYYDSFTFVKLVDSFLTGTYDTNQLTTTEYPNAIKSLQSIDKEKKLLIINEYCLNDYQNDNIEKGEVFVANAQTYNINALDKTKTLEAMSYGVARLFETKPDIKYCQVTMPYLVKDGYGYGDMTNSKGTFKDWCNSIAKNALHLGVPCVMGVSMQTLRNFFNIRISNFNTVDGNHANAFGIYFIAQAFAGVYEDMLTANPCSANVNDGVDDVYDISANNNGDTYDNLAAALGTNGANIPEYIRKGGMSVKFVQSPDNKYVQYRLMSTSWSTNVNDWQGVDSFPVEDSKNLIESGSIAEIVNDKGTYFCRYFTFDNVGKKTRTINNTVILNSGSWLRIKGNLTFLTEGKHAAAYFKTSSGDYIQKNLNTTGTFDFEYQATEDIQLVEYGINTNYAIISGNCFFAANLAPDFYKFYEQQVPINETTNELAYSVYGYFWGSTIGYIGSNGQIVHQSQLDYIVTNYIPVTEGQRYKYKGSWHQNDDISMVWGYDSNKQSPIALIPSANGIIDVQFVIPAGISYICAWSQTTLVTPSLLNVDSLSSRVEDLENTVNDLISTVDTISVVKNGTSSSFQGFVVNKTYVAPSSGVIKKLYFYSPKASNPLKICTCTKDDTDVFVVKDVYSYVLPQAGFNEIEVDITFKAGYYLGMCATTGNMMPYSTTQTDGWYWNQAADDVYSGRQIEGLYLENYSLSYGYLAVFEKGSSEEVITETIVATRNAANYNSIREIVNGLSASENHRYIVYVPNGEWFECDLQGKDYVEIVGQDKNATILYCDGTSSKLTPSDYSHDGKGNTALSSLDQPYKHVFFAKNNCVVRNLTVRAKNCKYCVHLDNNGYNYASFDNCIFIDQQGCNHPVGIGTHSGQKLEFTNCTFQSSFLTTGLVAHNWNNQSKPTKISIKDGFFDNCGFINVDELGSDQNDDWQVINCYSNVGGFLTFMVDKLNEDTYYINPSTGSRESDPTLVPYSIKLNCAGSNVVSCRSSYFSGNVQKIARPNFAKYIITDHYVKVSSGSYSKGSVIRKKLTGSLVDSNNVLGIVEVIIDGYAYIARDTVWLSQNDIQGTAAINKTVYEDNTGKVSVSESSKTVGKIISYDSSTGLYQIDIF